MIRDESGDDNTVIRQHLSSNCTIPQKFLRWLWFRTVQQHITGSIFRQKSLIAPKTDFLKTRGGGRSCAMTLTAFLGRNFHQKTFFDPISSTSCLQSKVLLFSSLSFGRSVTISWEFVLYMTRRQQAFNEKTFFRGNCLAQKSMSRSSKPSLWPKSHACTLHNDRTFSRII